MWLNHVLDNIKCDGEGLYEEAKQCHYSQEFTYECAAPINATAINNVSNVICTCKIRGGQTVCADCEYLV